MKLIQILDCPQIYQLQSETNAYLVVKNGKSLLIDCCDAELIAPLQDHGLPVPDIVLHTQIQREHCCECKFLSDAKVYVPDGCWDMALLNDQFKQDCKTVWSDCPEWDKRGQEKYGIAGCITERPPLNPLNVNGILKPGNVFVWNDLTFNILALPGAGKHSVGLFLRDFQLVFTGDLICNGGLLSNMYDLERGYGITLGYEELNSSLKKLVALKPECLLPSKGDVIIDPEMSIQKLIERTKWVFNPPRKRQENDNKCVNYNPVREFDHFREVSQGIYQNANRGNIIVFVDSAGRGMLIDPDPCISWENDVDVINREMDSLERNAGLKRIELILITHYHGDHIQFCQELRERYQCEIIATHDVAKIMEFPEEFNLPCTIEWYNMPVKSIKVDGFICYEKPFVWNQCMVTPIHTPGHCFAHTGYLLEWGSFRVACTGDTVQYGDGEISGMLPVVYNDTAWPDKGILVTLNRLKKYNPDLILCGHGQSFKDCDGSILNDMLEVNRKAVNLAESMVYDNDLLNAMLIQDEYKRI